MIETLRSVSQVKITEAGESDIVYEFSCEECDTNDGGLTKDEALEEFETHVCDPE